MSETARQGEAAVRRARPEGRWAGSGARLLGQRQAEQRRNAGSAEGAGPELALGVPTSGSLCTASLPSDWMLVGKRQSTTSRPVILVMVR